MTDKEQKSFIPEFLGSAITVNLDGRSEGPGYTTDIPREFHQDRQEGQDTRGAPWGMKPSLKSMADEVGVDFDHFIEALRQNKNVGEMAKEFSVSEKTIANLKEHFMRFGVDSVSGQD